MSIVVLDTSAWVALARNEPAAEAIVQRIAGRTVVLANVVLAELESLAERERIPASIPREAAETALYEPLTEDDAREGGRIHGAARRRRVNTSLSDALIVATARRMGATVLTTDRTLAREDDVEYVG